MTHRTVVAVERWIGIASLGLFVLFAAEMASIYNYMLQSPVESEFGIVFEADPKILQFISIGAAPASVMAAVSFILSRRYGSPQIGAMILGGSVAMASGMIFCYMLSSQLDPIYRTWATDFTPPLFLVLSIPVAVFGALLFRTKSRRRKKDYL